MAKSAVNYTGLIPETGDSFESATQNTTGSLEGIDIKLGELDIKLESGGYIGNTQDLKDEIDLKAPINSPIFTGIVVLPTTTSIGNVNSTEISYLDGVTSGIQAQLNGKQNTLISGSNIKTINGESLLGNGDIDLEGGLVKQFDTIADAQAYSGFVAGDRIQVLGYYSKNDEAGHERVYSLIDDGSGEAVSSGGYLNYVISEGKLVIKHFGVRDNTVSDTALIQKAINFASGNCKVVFTKGNYLINGNYTNYYTGINVLSNTHIKLDKSATINVDTNSTDGYTIFGGVLVNNVTIEGENSYLVGDRYTHIGTTGEQGFGVRFNGSTNIKVIGLYCKDFWGDGIIFMNSGNTISKNIKVLDCTCDNNRRQGMSVGSTVNMEIRNCIFINTNGTSPESGIDFEPNPTRPINENILVDNCHFENNRNCAIDIPFGDSHKNIKITNCTMIAKTGEKLFGYGLNAISNNIDNNLIIENCKIIGPNYIQGAKVLNTEFTINDNYPSNNWAIIDAVNVQSIYENITVHSFDAKRCINIGGGLSEKTRKFIKNMTIIKYGGTPTVPYLNSLLDYVTVENCKFLNSGLLPTTKYYNSVSANGLGDKCVFLNTFFDEGWQLNNKSNFMATYNSDNLAKLDVNTTAGENFRGMISVVEGGTGVADSVRVCVKGSDNLYSWKTFELT